MRSSMKKYFVMALLFALWGQLVAHAEAAESLPFGREVVTDSARHRHQ